MASTIAAVTTGGGGVITTADSSGNLSLLSGATTVVAVTSAGATVTGTLAVSGGVTLTTTLPVLQGGTGVTTSTGTGAGVHSVGPSISSAVMTTMASSVITSGTAVASTSGTSIDFTSIPSWVKRITLMLRNVSTNGASTPWLVQIGPSGGIETTGYQGTTSVVTSAVASYNITTGFGIQVDNSSTNVIEGSVTISLLDSATNTWVCSGSVAHSNRVYLVLMAYSKPIAGVLSRVRLTTSNGTDTFDAGSVNILYE